MKRAVIGLVIIAVLLATGWMIFYRPQKQAESLINDQVASTATALSHVQATERQLTRLGPPDATPLQQFGKVKPFADDFSKAANILKPFSDYKIQQPKQIRQFGFSSKSNQIKAINNLLDLDQTKLAYSQTGPVIKNTYDLINHQAAVLQMFVNLLEYNPKSDFSNFDLSSSDTQKRLKAAQAGLEKLAKQLNIYQSNWPDKTLPQLRLTINDLQTDLTKLTNGGPVEDWISAVNDAQQTIISNRKAFWDTDQTYTARRLLGTEIRLQNLNQKWQKLKS